MLHGRERSRAWNDVGRAIDWIYFPFEVRVNASLYAGSSAAARTMVIEGSGTLQEPK